MNKDFSGNSSVDDIEAATDLAIEQARKVREKAHQLREETRAIIGGLDGSAPQPADPTSDPDSDKSPQAANTGA